MVNRKTITPILSVTPKPNNLFEALAARHDPRSLFLTGAALLLSITMVWDLLLHTEDFNPTVLTILLILALCVGSIIGVLGARFPTWLAHSSVTIFTLASLFFLSPLSSEQPAVSTMQELPLIAFYLSWFVKVTVGRILIWFVALGCGAMMALNPIFHVEGSLGVVSGSQSLIVMMVCFEFGVALRVRTARRVSTDELTGALNRSGFMSALDSSLTKSLRVGIPLCLVVIDFDDFKQLNDENGHAFGDQALARTVAHWKENLRGKDVVGRTGGDEFAIILDRVDATTAYATMSRLRETSPYAWSWGISQALPRDTVESLFARGDALLYVSKRERQRARN